MARLFQRGSWRSRVLALLVGGRMYLTIEPLTILLDGQPFVYLQVEMEGVAGIDVEDHS